MRREQLVPYSRETGSWVSQAGSGRGPGDAHRVGVHRYGVKGVPVVVGSRVRLRGDIRVWVVEQMYTAGGGRRMQLFYDHCKTAKRTNVGYYVHSNGDVVLVKDRSLVEHVVFEENIFSIEAVCITIRNMHLPFAQNGMLISDTRLGPDCVRWLLGDELAAITQIPASSVEWLLGQGVSLLEVKASMALA